MSCFLYNESSDWEYLSTDLFHLLYSVPSCSTSSLHMSPSDDILTLERAFCKNFLCCDVLHQDLHALLEHFEGEHAFLVPADKRRTTRATQYYRPTSNSPNIVALTPFPSMPTERTVLQLPVLDHAVSPPDLGEYQYPWPLPESETSEDSEGEDEIEKDGVEEGKAVSPTPYKSHFRNRLKRDRIPCPNPGCIKTYLNPNGVKYHVDKGTCVYYRTQ